MPDHDPVYRRLLEEKIAAAVERSDEQHAALLALLSEIRDEVKATNGRVRGAEKAIAVLQFAYMAGASVFGGVITALVVEALKR